MQSNPERRPSPEDVAKPSPARGPKGLWWLSFWERHAAALLTKGGFWPDAVRRDTSDSARYQLWLFNHAADVEAPPLVPRSQRPGNISEPEWDRALERMAS